jgi:hypothetical protein
LSMHEERIAKFAQSEEEVSKASLKAIQELTHNTSITDLHIRDYDSALIISGNMKVMNEMATIEGKNSLQLNYLPFPHKYPRYWNEGTKIINYQTLDNRFDCSISFDNPIKLHAVENIHFSKDGFIFDFFVQQASDRSIRIRYSFSYNDVEITDLKQKSYSEVNRLIEHTLNGILLYE